MKKIGITNFALRHFDKKFSGTKILDFSPEEFLETIPSIKEIKDEMKMSTMNLNALLWYIRPGDFEFSKLITVYNFTSSKLSSMKIALDNAQYIRSDYFSRTSDELPVLSRWFEFPPQVEIPTADYLTLVLYSKEQIDKEGLEVDPDNYVEFDSEYGIVAIITHNGLEPDPIPPITMMRNSLGLKEGGNGVELDREKYMKSVEFWKSHVLIK